FFCNRIFTILSSNWHTQPSISRHRNSILSQGGLPVMKNPPLSIRISSLGIAAAMMVCVMLPFAANAERFFNRIATFPVYLNTDINLETVAEIIDVSKDGKTLVYTDSQTRKLGFVDIKKPGQPKALGAIDVGGEPTSVAVAGKFALVAVNSSPSFVTPSGHLHVVYLRSQKIIATHTLAGQPDSVSVCPAHRY